MEKWKKEKAFKELQILKIEESRKRECRGEIIKLKGRSFGAATLQQKYVQD